MESVVALTNLESEEVTPTCPVLEQDGSRIQLKVPKYLNVGSAVKIEADDTMSLGEICHFRSDGEGYIVWVDLFQALHNVAELSRLARALLG